MPLAAQVGLRLKQVWANLITDEDYGTVDLTVGSAIATDASKGSIFRATLDQNSTLSNPTGMLVGRTYTWLITQDGTGSWTLAFGSYFTFTGSSTIRPGANTKTIIRGFVVDATTIETTIVNAPGRVIQTVQADATTVNHTTGTNFYDGEVVGGITLTDSSNHVLVVCAYNFTITANTNAIGYNALYKGTIASPGAQLSKKKITGAVSTNVHYINEIAVAIDTAPGSTTPDYVINLRRGSGGTTSLQLNSTAAIYGPVYWFIEIST
jgi:hypothetical protein